MPRTRRPRTLLSSLVSRVVGVLLVLPVALGAAWIASRPATPDPFYRQSLPPAAQPGTLLASEPFNRGVPAGAVGWRLLYVTTRGGERALASAVVVAPEGRTGLRPVIAWAHATTGIVAGCAPSLSEKPFDNVPGLDAIVREGWAYVGTDYPGLGTSGGHAYLVGVNAARAVLDAVRAARKIETAGVGDRVVVWGHSQGGNTALWVGIQAGELAPELTVGGVAALAPASHLAGLVEASKAGMFGKIVSSYLVAAYAQAYPDVVFDTYVGSRSRLIVRDIAGRCVGGYPTLFSVFETLFLPADGIFAQAPTGVPLGRRLAENTPTGGIASPVLIAQGDVDDLVLPEVQNRYVAARCAAAQKIDYRRYAGRDHVSVVAGDSPLVQEIIAWTRDRFDGKPAKNTCGP